MTRLLVLPLALLAAPPLAAQSLDGTWRGLARCAGPNGAVLNAPVTLTVSGKSVRFNRLVPTPDGRSASGTEFGTGTLAANGTLKIDATLEDRGAARRSSYAGRIAGEVATLRGGSPACTIEARRS